jgi:bilirubin oxidase
MFHCHLLTHEDEGMMGQFVVMPLVSSQNLFTQADFSVFPNPFSESIDIQNSDYPEDFSVFNNMGKLVFSSDSKTERIETKIWPSGIYWMISSKGKRQKLIKFQ